jgi:6,7-dimethyl-8-ribityllumazine synthase
LPRMHTDFRGSMANSLRRHPSAALRAGSVTEKKEKKDFAVEHPPDADVHALEGTLSALGKSFAIVVSRFNAFVTERLFQSAYDGLLRTGARKTDIDLVRVPGAFEIPLAARKLAETKKYDAIICIGCLLRGDTAHYDVIVNEVTRGIGQSAQETGVPHAFGVLTCDTLEQAIDRAGLKMGNKGFDAALAAVEMASLKTALSSQLSAVSKKQIPPPRLRSGLRPSGSGTAARNDKVKDRNDKSKEASQSVEGKASKTKRRK